MTCNIIIDGVSVAAQEGQTILNAALDAGIFIPHLCSHPDLEAAGGCRLCVVEIDGCGKAVPSCSVTVQEGMNISTQSPAALKVRRAAMELILAAHPSECGDCPKYGKCELQSMYQFMGVSAEGRKRRHRAIADNASNPLILHRFTRCILCGRCVRACRELRGVKVLDYQRMSDGTVRIGTDGSVSLAEAGCRFCGACIEACPTGSILDQLGVLPEGVPHSKAVVPCRNECPAGIDIPQYLRYIKDGDYPNALAVIREKVPFPNALGHICNHVCETKCRRASLGGALSIRCLKGFAAAADDGTWKARGFSLPETGRSVAVVGAGPAGLTAAYYLKKLGHRVTVLEAREKAGGQLRYGIPAYRLPDEVLDRDISDILEVGIDLHCNSRVGHADDLAGYDASLMAIGTHVGVRLPMPGSDLPGVTINTEFLRAARSTQPPSVPDQVVVLGGGSVAFDCARTAIRLGAKEVHLACLEARAAMTAPMEEITDGEAEGVIVHDASSFLRITGTDHAEGVEIKAVSSFTFDADRRAVITTVDGSEQVLPGQLVIFATGQHPELDESFGLSVFRGRYIQTDEHLMSSRPGIFACSDAVTGTKSVVQAIAAGRSAAIEIDRYLGGTGCIDEQLTDKRPEKPAYLGRCEGFAGQARTDAPLLPAAARKCSFCDQELPMDPELARREASRCLQCDLRLEITQPKLWTDYEGRD